MELNRSYIDTVQITLNQYYDYKLQKGISSKKGTQYDLVDEQRGVVVFIEKLFKASDKEKTLIAINKRIAAAVSDFGPDLSFFLVLKGSLDLNDRLLLPNLLWKDFFEQEVTVLDEQYIFEIISNLDNLASDEFFESVKKTKESHQSIKEISKNLREGIVSNVEVDKSSKIILIDTKQFMERAEEKGERFYLANSKFNDHDLNRVFIEDRVLLNENSKADRIFNGINAGDHIILKSPISRKGKIYAVVRAMGRVAQNFQDGKRLEVNWNVHPIEIEIKVFERYQDSIQAIDFEDVRIVLDQLVVEQINLATLLTENKRRYSKANNFQPEQPIDETGAVIYGTHIGEEILKYNIFFLPKSSQEGKPENGITAHILKLLKVEHKYFNFSEKELQENGYQWFSFIVEEGRLNICFVVTKEGGKIPRSFKENLLEASASYIVANPGEGSNAEKKAISRIFIPLLGTYDGLMNTAESLKLVLDSIKVMRQQTDNSRIRINLAQEVKQHELSEYIEEIVKSLSTSGDHQFSEDDHTTTKKDKIPFHLDNVEFTDRLNREPVAKSLARLINGEIFSNTDLQHSFMVHLQGEWGAGKSTFLNLIEKHLDHDDHPWVVVRYNAWKNQHITPPWWSFIDQVYLQCLAQMKGWSWFRLWCNESYRRILWYSGWHKISSLVISLMLLVFMIFNYDWLLEGINKLSTPAASPGKEEMNYVEIYSKLLAGIGSVLGLIYSFSKFISTPFLMSSSGEAKSFVLRASDPMNKIKRHFNDLIGDVNRKKKDVAIFIDDIDRCNKEYTVELLEGIQTLFKEKRVLYIVAGDKNWITTCFSKNYEDFVDQISKGQEDLGELFLEKAFQLSIRMPKVSEKTKEHYWHHILGLTRIVTKTKTTSQLSPEERTELKDKLSQTYTDGDLGIAAVLTELENKYELSEESISDIAIETLDENADDIRHLFLDHFRLINPNPRAIKRLANNYTMQRNTLVAERKDFDPHKLFRWLILQSTYPLIVQNFMADEMQNLEEQLKLLTVDKRVTKRLEELIFDPDNEYGGPLKKEELKDIIGT